MPFEKISKHNHIDFSTPKLFYNLIETEVHTNLKEGTFIEYEKNCMQTSAVDEWRGSCEDRWYSGFGRAHCVSAQSLEFRQKGKSGTVESLLDHSCKLEEENESITHDSEPEMFYNFHKECHDGFGVIHHKYLTLYNSYIFNSSNTK